MINTEKAIKFLNEQELFKNSYPEDDMQEHIARQMQKYADQQLILSGVTNWVACKDALPLVTGFYTVCKPTKPYVLGLYFDSDKTFRYDKQVHKNITHWQKLPKPPCL